VILFASLAVILQWFVLLIIPDIARPGIFFGVTVAPGFDTSPEARRIRGTYRATLILSSLAALALIHWAPFFPGGRIALALPIQVAASMAGWIRANRQVKQFARAGETIRSASLESRPVRMPGGWLFFLGPLLVTAFAGVLLALNWSLLPDPLPVHWNIQGQPDRWARRTAATVFAPLLIVTFVNIAMLVMARHILFHTRQISVQGAAADREREFKRFNYLILVFAAYMGSLIGAMLAIRRIGAAPGIRPGGWPFFLILPVAIMAAVLFYAIRYGQGGIGRTGAPGATLGDLTPDACWKWGMIYYNPGDPAFLVEKRMGYGWTFNFGNKWAWVFLLLILAAPLLLALAT